MCITESLCCTAEINTTILQGKKKRIPHSHFQWCTQRSTVNWLKKAGHRTIGTLGSFGFFNNWTQKKSLRGHAPNYW